MRISATALAVAVIAASALSACGGNSGDTVAQVAGASPVSKALIDHWIGIEAVLAYRTIPHEPVPPGVTPVPPHYSACIAFLATNPPVATFSKTKSTPAQLKVRCRERYEEIKKKALGYMIAYRWVGGELAHRGIKVSEAEVNQGVRFFEKRNFSGPQDFRNYLAYAHMGPADLRFIVKYTVMGTKLQNEAILKKGMSAQQKRRELASFTKRWTAKTTCKAGYLVAGCKEYKGPETPL